MSFVWKNWKKITYLRGRENKSNDPMEAKITGNDFCAFTKMCTLAGESYVRSGEGLGRGTFPCWRKNRSPILTPLPNAILHQMNCNRMGGFTVISYSTHTQIFSTSVLTSDGLFRTVKMPIGINR